MYDNSKKIAIMGASELQKPLILKAKKMGFETHVFAWSDGSEGEFLADYFYPISLTETDKILAKCYKIGVDGACSIASDLGNYTASYVANNMGLIYNSAETVANSTNKILMRQCFAEHGVASPEFVSHEKVSDNDINLDFPYIIKPADRSGSRGVKKITNATEIDLALETALNYSFSGQAIAESFVQGEEFSVEYISHYGVHYFLALTKKFTTGTPHFIELGHIEPANLDIKVLDKIKIEAEKALEALGVKEGPSHIELKVNTEGVFIIEVGTRMGGDYIGSDLVQLSTGFDFLKATIEIYMGLNFVVPATLKVQSAAAIYLFKKEDLNFYENLAKDSCVNIVRHSRFNFNETAVVDSSSRKGFFICTCSDAKYLYTILEQYAKRI